jgi:hypothetical protein
VRAAPHWRTYVLSGSAPRLSTPSCRSLCRVVTGQGSNRGDGALGPSWGEPVKGIRRYRDSLARWQCRCRARSRRPWRLSVRVRGLDRAAYDLLAGRPLRCCSCSSFEPWLDTSTPDLDTIPTLPRHPDTPTPVSIDTRSDTPTPVSGQCQAILTLDIIGWRQAVSMVSKQTDTPTLDTPDTPDTPTLDTPDTPTLQASMLTRCRPRC